jgi:AcrR family transcriptional regulator
VSETREVPWRRRPQQARGQLRIHKILNAAEQVFAEVGYDNATTNAIAARAQTSIGSLYQFFPNKEAILKAIILRYLEEMRELLDQSMTSESTRVRSLTEFLEHLIHGLVALREAHVGFHPLFCATQASPELAKATTELHHEIQERIDIILAMQVPGLSPQQYSVCKRTSVAIFQSLMTLAMDLQGEERAIQLKEMHTVLRAYLQTYLDMQKGEI